MKADLLIRGAELLEADAAKGDGVRFDLGTWAGPYEDNPYNARGFNTNEKPPLNCNTKACAMGLFCLSGAFEKEGLRYDLDPRVDGSYMLKPIYGSGSDDGFYAAAKLFDIRYYEAERLFSPDEYDETKGAKAELAVAARMRALAAGENILPDPDEDYEDDEY